MRLYVWEHRLLYVGPGHEAGMHRHHAAQVCWGLGQPLRLQTAPRQGWAVQAGFCVFPDEPHALEAAGAPVALLYLESEGAEFAALQSRIGAGAVGGSTAFSPPPSAADGLLRLAAEGGSLDEADAICKTWLGLETGSGPRPERDPRISHALDVLRQRIGEPVRLRSLAAALGVSSSWLSHRFAEDIGIPLRRYVVWLRLRRAIERVLQGASWTEAAHAAGFSDSAHLSRSFRGTFGISPSSLFGARNQFSICVADA